MSTQPRLGTNDRQSKYTTKVEFNEPMNLLGLLTEAEMTLRQVYCQEPTQHEWQPMKARNVVFTAQLAC